MANVTPSVNQRSTLLLTDDTGEQLQIIQDTGDSKLNAYQKLTLDAPTLTITNGTDTITDFITQRSTDISTLVSSDTSITTRVSTLEINAGPTVVSTNASIRASADTSLQTRIAQEVTDRTTADTSLTTRVSTEEDSRSTAVSTEASSRTSAATSLETLITNLQSTVTAGVNWKAPAANIAAFVGFDSTAQVGDARIVTDQQDAFVYVGAGNGEDLSLVHATLSDKYIRFLDSTEIALNNTSITTVITAEETARIAADTSLTTRISIAEGTSTGLTSLETVVSDDVASIDTRITGETSSRSTMHTLLGLADIALAVVDSSIETRLSNEEDARTTLAGAVSGTGFSVAGSNPSKTATAPANVNDYIFSSGIGGNGSCRLIINSDTDNLSDESNNTQILFAKESDVVKGTIGMGVPGGTDTDNNDMILNTEYSDTYIRLRTQGVDRLKIDKTYVETTNMFNTVRSGESIRVQGTAAGAANFAYIAFRDSAGIRTGFVGDASETNSDIYVYSDSGEVNLRGTNVHIENAVLHGNNLPAASGGTFALTSDITNAVAIETTNRTTADASLTTRVSTEEDSRSTAVSTEASSRTSADTSLTTRISTAEDTTTTTANSINTRLSTSTSADTSLTTRISTEEDSRSSAISTEASSRASGDTSLTTRVSNEEDTRSITVSAETSSRTSADTSLTTRVSTEEDSRSTAVSTEASSRVSVDDSLSTRITNLQSTVTAGVDWKAPVADIAALVTLHSSAQIGDVRVVESELDAFL